MCARESILFSPFVHAAIRGPRDGCTRRRPCRGGLCVYTTSAAIDESASLSPLSVGTARSPLRRRCAVQRPRGATDTRAPCAAGKVARSSRDRSGANPRTKSYRQPRVACIVARRTLAARFLDGAPSLYATRAELLGAAFRLYCLCTTRIL